MKLEFLEAGAAECPLILLSGDEPAVVGELVRALAAVAANDVEVHSLGGVEPIDGCRLTATLGRRDLGVRRVRGLAFEWVMESEGWAQVCDLLAPFCEQGDAPRFQHLSSDGPVTVIITTDGHW
jgi:hypothetical protein